jgi:ABC-type nitrate/sulfonate/bicarbonate transport system ATPase subunit
VVMVTHGIEEAILLSDRIVVLGNPPGPSVSDVIPVGLPRPRVPVIDDSHYREIHTRLLHTLNARAAEAAA